MVGEVLREARISKHLTQKEIGEMVFCSDKTISAIENGTREASFDTIERLALQLDDPRLFLEASGKYAGGVYSTPWLDGERVDLHISSVWIKTMEELEEAEISLKKLKIANRNPDDEHEKQLVFESLMQIIDARVAFDHLIAKCCQTYKISVLDLFMNHRQKLMIKEFIKKKKDARQSTLK